MSDSGKEVRRMRIGRRGTKEERERKNKEGKEGKKRGEKKHNLEKAEQEVKYKNESHNLRGG